MAPKETVEEYFRRMGREWPAAGQVAAYRIEEVASHDVSFPHIRRDFHKIKLLRKASGILSYADQQVEVQGCALIFVNPHTAYSWQRLGGPEEGYTCLFTEQFVTPQLKTASVANSPLFKGGGTPVLLPPAGVASRLEQLFEQLLAELSSDYPGRYELVRNCLNMIVHEALKLVPPSAVPAGPAANWLRTQFLELLERQFPIASPRQPLRLRNANEYARHLAVHTNHLNKTLKDTTGKTTTEHLAGRLAEEACALLLHSSWSLAEISYCLGFEHPSNFAAFFKKQTGQPPHAYRRQLLALS